MDDFNLVGYSDSDFDGDKENIVSTLGYAVYWRSHKQSVIAELATEVEPVIVTKATKKIVWFMKVLEDL